MEKRNFEVASHDIKCLSPMPICLYFFGIIIPVMESKTPPPFEREDKNCVNDIHICHLKQALGDFVWYIF